MKIWLVFTEVLSIELSSIIVKHSSSVDEKFNIRTMSSASLIEKRSMKKFRSHNIETSSTSAPPTSISSADSTKQQGHNDRRLKEKMMHSRQHDSLLDMNSRKGIRCVGASNFELSNRANDFEQSVTHQKNYSK